MEFSVNRVQVSGSGHCIDVIPRSSPAEVWYVPTTPLQADKPAQWSYTRQGDFVTIPLHAYLTVAEPSQALGFAFQLGAMAVTQLAIAKFRVTRMHLSLGVPVSQVSGGDGDAISIRLGVGFLVTPIGK